jgi:cobalt/nickel transport system permease protein
MQLGDGLQNLGQLDHLAEQDSPIHRLDPRMKIAVTMLYLLAIASLPRTAVSSLVPFAVYPYLLAILGRVPARLILRRILWTLPFALTLGAFNPVIDRTPAIVLGPVVLSTGWLSFISLLMRFILAVSTATVLAATTGMARICDGLEGLGVTKVFATQVAFLYRYAFLLAEEALRLRRARDLRANGKSFRPKEAGTLLGHLLLRAWSRAHRVHAAMLARGFEGHFKSGPRPALNMVDIAFASTWIAVFALLRFVHVSLWIGGLWGLG